MKDEIRRLLPQSKKEKNEEEICEKFFLESKELQKIIQRTEKEGKYFIKSEDLKKIKCPIKRDNGKDYWEAFFIFLGFEFYQAVKSGGYYLIIRK